MVDEKAHDAPEHEKTEHRARADQGLLCASVEDFLAAAASTPAAPDAVDAAAADPLNGALVAEVDLLAAEPAGLVERHFSFEGRGRGIGSRHELLSDGAGAGL